MAPASVGPEEPSCPICHMTYGHEPGCPYEGLAISKARRRFMVAKLFGRAKVTRRGYLDPPGGD